MKVRDNMEKATTLSEIRMTCRYYPLDTEDLTKFYIDTTEARGTDILGKLELFFEYVPQVYQQVLYLGHTGSGKSTLLFQLEKKVSDTYNVIRFSVQEMLDMNDDLTIVDLMCVIYERIYVTCKDYYNKKDEEVLKNIYQTWYTTIVKENESVADYNLEADAEAGIGLKGNLLSLFVKLTNIMKLETTKRTLIRSEVVKNINEYIHNLNELAQISSRACGKPIFLMLENLEKISIKAANKIFISQSDYFHLIKIRMLLTTPIYLQYFSDYMRISTQNFTATEKCSMIAVQDIYKNEYGIGIKTMRDIVYARVSSNLIEESALNLAIQNSGGVLRDLLQIVYYSSIECQMDKRTVINSSDVNKVFIKLANDYGNIIRNGHIPLLKRIYNNEVGVGIIDDLDDEFLKLVRNEAIIEYDNGNEQWRGVHPAVVEYLKKQGVDLSL